MENQTPQLSPSVISILQVLNEPATYETAFKMFEDSRRQFLNNEIIDPFASYRVTREEADRINLVDDMETSEGDPLSPSAGDRAEAGRFIDESEGDQDDDDGSGGEREDSDNWEVEIDPDAEEESEVSTATTVPRRFGSVWSGYVTALETFWSRAENLRFEDTLFENHEQICAAGMALIRLKGLRTVVFKANLELVDRLITIVSERSIKAIGKLK